MQDSGYLVTIGKPHTNGQPNCQGLSGQYVADNSLSDVYIRVRGDTAWVQAGPNAPALVLTRVRSSRAVTTPH